MASSKYVIILIIVVVLVIIIMLLATRSCVPKPDSQSPASSKTGNLMHISDSIPLSPPSYVQKIPFIIMQTNERRKVPTGMYAAIQSIRDMNPEYEYHYYDDAECREYLDRNYGERYVAAYDDLIPGAFKADFFRYAFLYRTGGVYIDAGMVAVSPLRMLIDPSDEFIAPEDDDQGGIYNAFICVVPGHPILQNALENCLTNIERHFFGTDTLQITGPDLIAASFEVTMMQGVASNRHYGSGIRLIYHKGPGIKQYVRRLTTGGIYDKTVQIMITKYPGYYLDMAWYHTNKHYSILWMQGSVYKSVPPQKWKSRTVVR